jgi:hypothetical protein
LSIKIFCCANLDKLHTSIYQGRRMKRSRDFILTLEDDDNVASQSESEPDDDETADLSNNKKRKKDQDLNPDFEFDGYGALGGVKGIDDDGWGFKGITGIREGAGVDLDGIIARRRENLESNTESNDQSDEESDDGSTNEGEFKGFDDDDIGTMSIGRH